jgi:hypothetical protein
MHELTDSSLSNDPGESKEEHDTPNVEKTSHLNKQKTTKKQF